jgi:phosphoribosylanthranilate isomerase
MQNLLKTRVKICGITRVEDALAAVHAGADAIGLVFYEKSPRAISIAQAKSIVAAMPPFVCVVGLFVNATPEWLNSVLSQVDLDLVQFHGDEAPAQCEQINMPYCKAIRMKADTNLLQYASDYANAKALLLDAFHESAYGGTGHTFDWSLIPTGMGMPLILAGGLTVDNVAVAIEQVRPYAVDISGGVESSKGIKDAAKIAAFMQAVNETQN